jgi:ribosomal protein S18 acetylase RimI-like enzyme
MTIITFPLDETRSTHPHLRRFDARTDLLPVADLVERCFNETLDADGRRYIQNMRRTAESPQFFRWASGVSELSGAPFNGFVWEREGAIIGNLSLIPMPARGEKIFLIANVAVHPDHRRKGIARSLTDAALEESRRRRADRVWLHVRADNPAAIRLYERLGFTERARRTTWYNTRRDAEPVEAAGVGIVDLSRRHWAPALDWFHRLHPPELDWYLALDLRALRPSPAGWIHRLLTGSSPRTWAAVRDDRPLAVLAWQGTHTASDRLWLAAPQDADPAAIRLLIRHAEGQLTSRKPLNLEYPAGRAAGVLESAGFNPHPTLIWMERG